MGEYKNKQIVLTEELRKELKEYSKTHDMNESQTIRKALRLLFSTTLGDIEDKIKQKGDEKK